MKFDKKILWQYIYYEFMNPKKFIKSISFYRYLVLFLLIYIVFFTKIILKFKIIIAIISFIIFFYLDIKEIERSGEHRFWHKKKTGIPTRSDIRSMKYGKKKSAQEILDEAKPEEKSEPTEQEKKEYEDTENKIIEEESKKDLINEIKNNAQEKINVPEKDEVMKGGLKNE